MNWFKKETKQVLAKNPLVSIDEFYSQAEKAILESRENGSPGRAQADVAIRARTEKNQAVIRAQAEKDAQLKEQAEDVRLAEVTEETRRRASLPAVHPMTVDQSANFTRLKTEEGRGAMGKLLSVLFRKKSQ